MSRSLALGLKLAQGDNRRFYLTMGLEHQANNSGNIIHAIMYIQYCITHTYTYTYIHIHISYIPMTCIYIYT